MATGEEAESVNFSLVNERTRRLAKGAGERAMGEAQAFLARHADLVAPQLAEMLSKKEYDLAYARTVEARLDGRQNDQHSEAPGLIAYFTKRGREMLTEAGEKETDAPWLAKYAATMQPTDETETVFSLRLPNGTYGMGMGECQFYAQAEQTASGNRPVIAEPMSMPNGVIVRIEGDCGEVWQNCRFNLDGSQREQ